jgi:N-methylhydantoinase A
VTVATDGTLSRQGGDHTIMRGYKGFGLEQEVLKNYHGLVNRYSIVDQTLVREVPERIVYLGRVIRPLDEKATGVVLRELVAQADR